MKMILSLLILLLPIIGVAQSQYGTKHFIKRQGYLFCLSGLTREWFFQPVSVQRGPLESLDGNSFPIQLLSDGFNNSIAALDRQLSSFDSIAVSASWDSSKVSSTLYYAFGEMEYGNTAHLPFENLHPCLVRILFERKQYSLGCTYFLAEVKDFVRL